MLNNDRASPFKADANGLKTTWSAFPLPVPASSSLARPTGGLADGIVGCVETEEIALVKETFDILPPSSHAPEFEGNNTFIFKFHQ
ncbi:hypothetical protein D9623_23895 [Azospirillum brasilense]|uniref:Uncharacterized protein n=1 Tax=Azospirillum brasilense TaxID=192 RepID=A0A4D8QTG3_AZOBR|nr:hypothetical protein AEJ54_19670 [Azospirillum sp. Sp 7]QCO12016.1 hypothetical protein D3868_23485 [Azospirillum brasilense]QEL93147.1 hypothetical protein D9621_23610 [Azospirillum brasilense]QEL99468.1 hypothetical protein D9623_23895 [Azospirillum brasilense]